MPLGPSCAAGRLSHCAGYGPTFSIRFNQHRTLHPLLPFSGSRFFFINNDGGSSPFYAAFVFRTDACHRAGFSVMVLSLRTEVMVNPLEKPPREGSRRRNPIPPSGS